jgi:DNA mismatch repair protein MutS
LRSARPRDLTSLRASVAALPAMHAILKRLDAPLIIELMNSVSEHADVFDILQRAVAEEPSVVLRDGDVIAPGYDAALDELRQISTHTDEFLLELERRERERSGISSLKLAYNRVSGFFIEVNRSQADNVPKDYIRRQTVKNAERFITPELKSFEDKVLGAREKALAREREIYEQVLTQLTDRLGELQATAEALASLDTLSALAERAAEHSWTEPKLVAETCLEIRGGRHPVVEHFIDGRSCPMTCCSMPSRRMLVVTGPNMGGKSTYMRQGALIALLAHVGSFVPAEKCVLGPLDRIFTRIGAGDDLAGGRSTLMVEMTEAANILNNATDKSLILMDEIGRGTSTFDGLSLAWAVARHIARVNRSFTLFATHYFELTSLAQEMDGIANVHLTPPNIGTASCSCTR